ncbi:hypothetical protein C8J57DRAFT_1523951 [Mycena rebaudengoi]|nr:hypothetical protein C8J57DRAFT_1523951 [Mycena rebaudengoi]
MSSTKLHVPNALDAHKQDVSLAFNITGIVLTAALLLAIACTARNPVSRQHLNRVSFRLLVCALIANLIFAATSIPVFSGPSAGCSLMAFFGMSVLMLSACMFFCTALNLQLVLVYHLNGNSIEKFYYIGSVVVVAILNITPYAAGQFGHYYGTCWFSDLRPDVQFRWLLWSQAFWILLMSSGEVLLFFMILGYMYIASPMHAPRLWSNHSTSSFNDSIPDPPIVMYRNIILRIGLYPLLSCCLNFTGAILDIWLTKNPILTELQWRLSWVDFCVFSLRPILYTLLAATDPGFLRAMHALRHHSKSTPSAGSTSGTNSMHFTCPTSKYTSSHEMKQFSTNSRALVHVQLEHATHSTRLGAWGDQVRVEQSTATLEPSEEQSAVSHGNAKAERGQSSSVEREGGNSGLGEAERERGAEDELDATAQIRSRAEDIVRQI